MKDYILFICAVVLFFSGFFLGGWAACSGWKSKPHFVPENMTGKLGHYSTVYKRTDDGWTMYVENGKQIILMQKVVVKR